MTALAFSTPGFETAAGFSRAGEYTAGAGEPLLDGGSLSSLDGSCILGHATKGLCGGDSGRNDPGIAAMCVKAEVAECSDTSAARGISCET